MESVRPYWAYWHLRLPVMALITTFRSRHVRWTVRFPHRTRAFVAVVLLAAPFATLGAPSQNTASSDSELKATAARMDAFEEILKIKPADPSARKGEVDIAIASGLTERSVNRMEAALWLLLRAKYWVPDNPDLLLDLGIQEGTMKFYVDADSTLAEALRLRPDDPKTLYSVARIKMDLGLMQAAGEAWLAYLKQRPDDARAHYGYGAVLQTLQRFEEARTQFEESIRLDPHQAESYYRMGQMARDSGNAAEARKLDEEALARNPTHAGALTDLAILNYKLRKYDDAEKELEAAIESSPDYQTARYYHGLTLARLGRHAESETELSQAIQMANDQNAKNDQQKRLAPQPYRPN
jgi:tetratricopeptide (TPR) repeat protein